VLPDDPSPSSAHPSELTTRFAALMVRRQEPCALDEACTLVAAHFAVGADADGTDLRAVREGLDELAKGVPEVDFGAVTEHLGRLGLGGDPSDYASPISSMLPDVVRRRRGLPILLAVVTVEVARRVGVSASVAGMPGHVLVVATDDPTRLADPFHRRPGLDQDEARALFARLHGEGARWDPAFLDPLAPPAVLARILANLARRYRADKAHRCEAVALGLRTLVPGVGLAEKGALAAALARGGAFDRAAAELEDLAAAGGAGTDPAALRTRARQWRARLN